MSTRRIDQLLLPRAAHFAQDQVPRIARKVGSSVSDMALSLVSLAANITLIQDQRANIQF